MATATRTRTRTAIPYEMYTEELCKEWAKNPTVNPVTGRVIRTDTVNSGVYDKISKACEKFGVTVPNATVKTRTVTTKKQDFAKYYKDNKLFTSINGYPFPDTYNAQWTALRKAREITMKAIDAKMIIRPDFRYVNAIMTHFNNAKRLLYLENEFKEANIKFLYTLGGELEKDIETLKANDIPVVEDPKYVHQIYEILWKMVTNYLTNGTHPREEELTVLETDATTRIKYFKDSTAEDILQKIQDFKEIVREMQLEKADHDVVQEDENIPESRIRSSPGSLSASDSRSRKYSASYKRHSKYSQVSAFDNASPTDVAKLPAKTRQRILQELKSACTIMKDTITYERFDRMNKKNLMLVVQLGPGESNKHCFYVRNLYNAWKQAVKDNKPFVDPLNGVPVTGDEKDDIMRKMRLLKKGVKDPRDVEQKVPKAVELAFTLVEKEDEDGILHNFYEVSVRTKKKYGKSVIIVMKLGYIPADIEPEDMGGSLNMSSAVLVSNIKKLFDTGRLLVNNSVPYKCCRVHLRKPFEYWFDPDGPKGISAHRFRLMVDEIERYL